MDNEFITNIINIKNSSKRVKSKTHSSDELLKVKLFKQVCQQSVDADPNGSLP